MNILVVCAFGWLAACLVAVAAGKTLSLAGAEANRPLPVGRGARELRAFRG
jgi:hypothetical protein